MVQEELDKVLLQEIVSALQAKRGQDIVELDMRHVHSPICNHKVEERVGAATGEYPFRTSERSNAEWVVMDYFSVMVHIFLPSTREYYNLEGLWGDAPRKEYAEED